MKVFGKFVEGGQEFALLLGLTERPVAWLHLFDQRFVDAVDDRVESGHGVFRNFSKENFAVVLARWVDWLSRRRASDEVHALAEELFLFTYTQRNGF